MTNITNSQAITALIARSGIMQQLADEAEANRVAQHADLAQRKAAALATFQKQKPLADAAVAAADKSADDATKSKDAAQQAYIAARTKLDTVYGNLTAVTDVTDKAMRECCDPAIDVFITSLNALKADCPNLFRLSSDGKSDNRAAVQARIVALNDASDAADRLKIDPNVTDVPGALAAILTTVPKA